MLFSSSSISAAIVVSHISSSNRTTVVATLVVASCCCSRSGSSSMLNVCSQYARVCGCLCVCVYALRIVSPDTILRFINTCIFFYLSTVKVPSRARAPVSVKCGSCTELHPGLLDWNN